MTYYQREVVGMFNEVKDSATKVYEEHIGGYTEFVYISAGGRIATYWKSPDGTEHYAVDIRGKCRRAHVRELKL